MNTDKLMNEIADLKKENAELKLRIGCVSGSLLPAKLMQIHPELNYSEAVNLMEFAKSKTITHEECYGDGSIIYPMWKDANYR